MLKSTEILHQIGHRKGQIAVLIDPDKCHDSERLDTLIKKASFAKVDYFFIGGSTVSQQDFGRVIKFVKSKSEIPVIIFPGSAHQISSHADALLYLSLISGRNPDYLIGHHVQSAQEVFNLGIEVIPTAYILIDGGTTSSVAYVSQTTPIPNDKETIILNTAKAGILLGKRITYLDAGSGAAQPVPDNIVASLSALNSPIIVGGGIRSREKISSLSKAGANVIVIGNQLEEDINFLLDIQSFIASKQ